MCKVLKKKNYLVHCYAQNEQRGTRLYVVRCLAKNLNINENRKLKMRKYVGLGVSTLAFISFNRFVNISNTST